MEEDEQDADGTDVADAEQVDAEETATQGSSVGELIINDIALHIPSHEQTGEKTTYGQEELTSGEVEQVE